ncbi:hypothetical protein N9873_03745 [Akkermansiaceae bacterium]|nr:hypothetical protein [Akkermansiaceae bacterium]MDB4286447.1 hypothetical protein [bacterium]MDA7519235.1 hypothetical protein [Akkermansiaceae bacterium]MDA7864021.1 hypothetical protein [Akkermansiaceae bacterium]MDA8876055.1 hypothetical protein [Akkermansiaceae bacterium]
MKNSAIIIVLVAALLGVVIVEESRISSLKDELAANQNSPSEVPKVRAAPSSTPSTLGSRDTSVAVRPKKGETENAETPLEGFGKAMRKMADNPAAKAMFTQAHISTAESIYASLLEEFDLKGEERDYFLGLLSGELADQQQMGMKMMGAKTPEERKQAIADFLNNKEDQEAFETYHDRLPEHQQLPGIKAAIATSGTELSGEQETALVEVMHSMRTGSAEAQKWDGAGGMEMMAKPDVVEIFEADWAKGKEAYKENLQGVLDDGQMKAFLESQAQMKEMHLMGIKMMRNMMQAGE